MAKISVTYRAPKGDEKVVEMGGHTFFDGKVEKVDSESEAFLLAKLRTNRHFEVSEKDAPKEPPKTTAPTAKIAAVVLLASEQADGTFAIMNGADLIKEGLTKEDADAFNALSDEDKAEYVTA
ncbi:hypothetical protein [Rhizobium hainanense]|uniref:Uncharacterized protein n=1 Tax=Rhizobium hainanense TaxID=52131 RepID=A0A1C3ULY7_9HYPH|nr:hypothetical protein [Rhizobium hainanense]SCB16503.1 hypothetical protein GA0061100_102616 [Rhizobium hainanense]